LDSESAVFMLITSSNFVGCLLGSEAAVGFAGRYGSTVEPT
jgi:hypothetical protein